MHYFRQVYFHELSVSGGCEFGLALHQVILICCIPLVHGSVSCLFSLRLFYWHLTEEAFVQG